VVVGAGKRHRGDGGLCVCQGEGAGLGLVLVRGTHCKGIINN